MSGSISNAGRVEVVEVVVRREGRADQDATITFGDGSMRFEKKNSSTDIRAAIDALKKLPCVLGECRASTHKRCKDTLIAAIKAMP